MKKKTQWYLGFAVTLFMAFIAYQGIVYSSLTTQASVDYGLSTNSDKLYNFTGSRDSINVWSRNGGGIDGSFYLTVRFTNATVYSPQSYIVDNTSVKLPHVLHKSGATGDSVNTELLFNIDEGASGFSATVSLDKRDLNPMKVNPFQYQTIRFEWDRMDNCFKLVE